MNNTFELESLISLPAREAESLLKEQGIDYAIKRIKSFKPIEADIEAVVKAVREDGKAVLYLCGFKSGKEL